MAFVMLVVILIRRSSRPHHERSAASVHSFGHHDGADAGVSISTSPPPSTVAHILASDPIAATRIIANPTSPSTATTLPTPPRSRFDPEGPAAALECTVPPLASAAAASSAERNAIGARRLRTTPTKCVRARQPRRELRGALRDAAEVAVASIRRVAAAVERIDRSRFRFRRRRRRVAAVASSAPSAPARRRAAQQRGDRGRGQHPPASEPDPPRVHGEELEPRGEDASAASSLLAIIVRRGDDDRVVVADVVQRHRRAQPQLHQKRERGVEAVAGEVREQRAGNAARRAHHLAMEKDVVLEPPVRVLQRRVHRSRAGRRERSDVVRDDALQERQRVLAADAQDATGRERGADGEAARHQGGRRDARGGNERRRRFAARELPSRRVATPPARASERTNDATRRRLDDASDKE
eukprot:30943-Pelagococcus_subviridis.AAC.8